MAIPHGEISFKPHTLLRLDNAIIEASSLQPAELKRFIDTAEPAITARITTIYQRSLELARRPDTKERRAIQIARLALYESYASVFRVADPDDIERVTKYPFGLTPYAGSYWNAVAETNFQPEIHFRRDKANLLVRGIWLGVKLPE